MPSAAFVVNRAMINYTGPASPIRLSGFGVLAAVAYDGRNGIESIKATEPMSFVRTAQRDHEFDLWGDGLLVRSFDEIPKDLGWIVTLTLTNTNAQALELLSNLFKIGAEIVKAFPGPGPLAGTILGAGSMLASATKDIPSAKTIGTWIGSEIDDGDLKKDFSAEYSGRKTWFQAQWRVGT
jgi:hypothetical protein